MTIDELISASSAANTAEDSAAYRAACVLRAAFSRGGLDSVPEPTLRLIREALVAFDLARDERRSATAALRPSKVEAQFADERSAA